MAEIHRCKSQTFEQVQCCTILDKVPWILVNHHFQISVATKIQTANLTPMLTFATHVVAVWQFNYFSHITIRDGTNG